MFALALEQKRGARTLHLAYEAAGFIPVEQPVAVRVVGFHELLAARHLELLNRRMAENAFGIGKNLTPGRPPIAVAVGRLEHFAHQVLARRSERKSVDRYRELNEQRTAGQEQQNALGGKIARFR